MNKAELDNLLSEGEGYYIEFKRSVDKSLILEATAFANASGGKIVIGVDDYNKVVGTDTSNVAKSQIVGTLSKI